VLAQPGFGTNRALQILDNFLHIMATFHQDLTASKIKECDDIVEDLPHIVSDTYQERYLLWHNTGDPTKYYGSPNEFLCSFYDGINCIENTIVSDFCRRYVNFGHVILLLILFWLTILNYLL
jgi:hypothetical protein